MPQRNILLHKATKARQTRGGGGHTLRLCIEPLLSKFPLSRTSHPAVRRGFFWPLAAFRFTHKPL